MCMCLVCMYVYACKHFNTISLPDLHNKGYLRLPQGLFLGTKRPVLLWPHFFLKAMCAHVLVLCTECLLLEWLIGFFF